MTPIEPAEANRVGTHWIPVIYHIPDVSNGRQICRGLAGLCRPELTWQ